jgi:hypothetical protein
MKRAMKGKPMAMAKKSRRRTLASRVLGKGEHTRGGFGKRMASGGKVGPR